MVEVVSLERFVSDRINQYDAEGRLAPFYDGYREEAGAIPPTIHG